LLTPNSEVGSSAGTDDDIVVGTVAVAPLIEFEFEFEADTESDAEPEAKSKGRISVIWAFSKKGIVLFCVSANCQPISVLVLKVSITNQGDGFCVGNK
jgi:hypothetical protein